MTLAELIRTRIAELHTTPYEVARRAKLEPALLYQMLNGAKTNPTAKTVDALALALGVPADAILTAARTSRQATLPPVTDAMLLNVPTTC